MTENRLERRGAQRFEVHQPLAVHFGGQTVPGFIQDLSGRGIFFYAETTLPQGAVVELTFTMPSEITLAENMPVRCRGRVLRSSAPRSSHSAGSHSIGSQAQAGQRTGIAVQFDAYEYLPANELTSQFVRVSTASGVLATSGPAAR